MGQKKSSVAYKMWLDAFFVCKNLGDAGVPPSQLHTKIAIFRFLYAVFAEFHSAWRTLCIQNVVIRSFCMQKTLRFRHFTETFAYKNCDIEISVCSFLGISQFLENSLHTKCGTSQFLYAIFCFRRLNNEERTS